MPETTVHLQNKIEHALVRESGVAQARSDAFAFAAKCKADVSCIQAEIESEATSIRQTLASKSYGSNNPMTPGASPRMYRDAYVTGLREALALIQEISGNAPDVEASV